MFYPFRGGARVLMRDRGVAGRRNGTLGRYPCPTLTAELLGPSAVRMALAHPADAETDLAVGVDHETSLTGWCRYASIAQFERTSLRRSPHLNLSMISSSKKLADQFGSPSSPLLSRTLQAIWKDCSISSVSVMRGERLRSCHVPGPKSNQTRKLIRVSITKEA